MSNFLFSSQPLVFNPDLADLLGLNEAIVLHQLDYWIKINKKKNSNFRNGRFWTYNTYEKWREDNFKFWSEKTIKRTFSSLENMGVVISSTDMNTLKQDRTKWYTIDYEVLEKLEQDYLSPPSGQNVPMHNGADFEDQEPENPHGYASGQVVPMVGSNWAVASGQIGPTITRDYTETKTDINPEEEEDTRKRDEYYSDDIFVITPEPEQTKTLTKDEDWPTAYREFLGIKAMQYLYNAPERINDLNRYVNNGMNERILCNVIEQAKIANNPYAYIVKVLDDMENNGVKTFEDFLRYKLAREGQKQAAAAGQAYSPQQPKRQQYTDNRRRVNKHIHSEGTSL